MAYINKDSLGFDPRAKKLSAGQFYEASAEYVDRELRVECERRGVTIVTDANGYLVSEYLYQMAINFTLYTLFSSAWGVRDTADLEMYRDAAYWYGERYNTALRGLSAGVV
jgi:hypothetical protein